MKKVILVLLITMLAFSCAPIAFAEGKKELAPNAKAAFLTDENANEEIYSKNADTRYPIASMVKIMTALLTCEAVDRGEATVDEEITISQTASGYGGSQMFLDSGLSYKLGDLLKGVIVVSANDACAALAERLAGSEEGFVLEMNERAKELNMQNTHFANCTGLPAVGGYSSARDVAKMLSELSKHELYHKYSEVWLEDFEHPDGRTTTFTNTNKLIRFYDGCDGGKTGFTNEAGFCLAATAKRNGLRVISVVIGEADSKTRFAESSRLLDHAFGSYVSEKLVEGGKVLGEMEVNGGKQKLSYAAEEDLVVTGRRGVKNEMRTEIELFDLKAPVSKGEKVGKIYAISNGIVVKEGYLIALNDVEKETYGDAVGRVADEWGVK